MGHFFLFLGVFVAVIFFLEAIVMVETSSGPLRFFMKKETLIWIGVIAAIILWTMLLVHLAVKAVAFIISLISSLL